MAILTNNYEFIINNYELIRFSKIENITLVPLIKLYNNKKSTIDKKFPLYENSNLVGEIIIKPKVFDNFNDKKVLLGDVCFFNKVCANLLIENDFFIFPDIEIVIINDYYNYNYRKFLISKKHFINNSKIILKSFKQQEKNVNLPF